MTNPTVGARRALIPVLALVLACAPPVFAGGSGRDWRAVTDLPAGTSVVVDLVDGSYAIGTLARADDDQIVVADLSPLALPERARRQIISAYSKGPSGGRTLVQHEGVHIDLERYLDCVPRAAVQQVRIPAGNDRVAGVFAGSLVGAVAGLFGTAYLTNSSVATAVYVGTPLGAAVGALAGHSLTDGDVVYRR